MRRLRSWWKQERIALRQRRWRFTLLFGGGCVALVLAMEGSRRSDNLQEQARQEQNRNLDVLQWQVRDSQRTSQDWAHWDDSLAFAEGRNPDFPVRDMGTTSLLKDGAVMAIFGNHGRRLAIAGGAAEDRRADSPLSRCLRDVDQKRRRENLSHLEVICPGHDQFYVGNIEALSNNDDTVVSQASLTYVLPMLSTLAGSPVAQAMTQLQRELVLGAAAPPHHSELKAITPPLWTTGARPALVRAPAASSALRRELLALAAVVAAGAALVLTLRLQWMLGQRRQLLLRRRQERLYNQRLRRSERELEQLLDQVQGSNRDDAVGAFARLLERKIVPPSDADSQRQERLANRVELVLAAARSLVLLDSLTGLPNRNFFLERLAWQSEQSRSRQEPLALLFINIDKFKQINETYGHRAGDDVIRHVATELRRILSDDTFLARFGGDEFSLILHTSGLNRSDQASIRDHAHQQALELLEAFHRNARQQSEHLRISLSIGIALSDPGGTSAEELIRRSDMAMSRAKTRLTDRISVFDISREIDALNDYRLFNALQSDLSHHPDRFSVLFQPIVNGNGSLHKLEALCRWQNPDFPDVSPDLFFSVAERYRLIQELGQLILDTTFRSFNQLRHRLQQPDLQLALNISPSQLGQRDFGQRLLEQLRWNDLNPSTITMEITESAVVETSEELNENLRTLRSAGVHLALDDFGTGFSSLRLLMWLKPDELKIDKSFVAAASRDPVAHQIVRLLQSLAQEMKLTLVAEGVEQQHVLTLLREAGLDRFQGYLFARAQPAEDLLHSLRAQPLASGS